MERHLLFQAPIPGKMVGWCGVCGLQVDQVFEMARIEQFWFLETSSEMKQMRNEPCGHDSWDLTEYSEPLATFIDLEQTLAVFPLLNPVPRGRY